MINSRFNRVKVLCLVLTIYAFALACKDDSRVSSAKPLINIDTYRRIDIYCWCLYDSAVFGPDSRCETPIAIRPSEIVREQNLLDSITDSSTVARIVDLVFRKQKERKVWYYGADSRFLLMFRRSDNSADTLVFNQQHTFSFNGIELFMYSFDVFDSLRTILNKPSIHCKTS
jgi:hypothetical protein